MLLIELYYGSHMLLIELYYGVIAYFYNESKQHKAKAVWVSFFVVSVQFFNRETERSINALMGLNVSCFFCLTVIVTFP